MTVADAEAGGLALGVKASGCIPRLTKAVDGRPAPVGEAVGEPPMQGPVRDGCAAIGGDVRLWRRHEDIADRECVGRFSRSLALARRRRTMATNGRPKQPARSPVIIATPGPAPGYGYRSGCGTTRRSGSRGAGERTNTLPPTSLIPGTVSNARMS